jgi:hypothetical protein
MDMEHGSDVDTRRTDRSCGKTISYEEALQCCLDRMEEGSGLPLEKDLRKKIGDLSIKKFKDNHDKWPALFEKVLKAARKIGELAEQFAVLEAELNGQPFPSEIKERHAIQAVRVVRELCPAAMREDTQRGDSKRYMWCPDPS